MKVCIPTETNDGKAAQIFGHFGSAPYFTICDTEKNTIEIIDNANQHHAHGSCQPLSVLNGKKVDVIVTGGMGGRAVMMLNNAGVKAYQAIIGTVEDVLTQYASGSLKEITPENACSQHNCGGH